MMTPSGRAAREFVAIEQTNTMSYRYVNERAALQLNIICFNNLLRICVTPCQDEKAALSSNHRVLVPRKVLSDRAGQSHDSPARIVS
jgi:hypothetical protein